MKIAIVGVGFLGSLVAEELVRYLSANSILHDIVLIDPESVEIRNVYSQGFVPEDIGEWKVDAVMDRLESYDVPLTGLAVKVDHATSLPALDECHLVIDCVDNVPTRQWLHTWALKNGIPCLHAGITLGGTGSVEWSAKGTTYSLANYKQKEDAEKLAPCMLVSFRPLGYSVAAKTAISACAYLGIDVIHRYGDDCDGTMVNWVVSEQNLLGGDEKCQT